jgi:hypothetical protein
MQSHENFFYHENNESFFTTKTTKNHENFFMKERYEIQAAVA